LIWWQGLPSATLTAEWEEVEDMAVFHLAMRAYGFHVAFHHGEALVWGRCHGFGDGRGGYI
jgi:hypothetical protein